MPVMDEFKEQRDALKSKSPKEKISYFFYYYKWHVLGGAALVALLFALGRDMLNAKDVALFGAFVNASSTSLESPDEFVEDFAAYADIDLEQYSMDFEHTLRMGQSLDSLGLEANQMIMVYMAAGDLDVMAMDEFNFNKYSYKTAYSDLRTHFSEETLAQYEEYLFYIDEAFLTEVERISKEETLDYVIEYPDYTNPDAMENPIPVGINLAASAKFREYFSYGDETAFIGIVLNTKQPEHCRKLIEFLFPVSPERKS